MPPATVITFLISSSIAIITGAWLLIDLHRYRSRKAHLEAVLDAALPYRCGCGRFASPDDLDHIDLPINTRVVERHAPHHCELVETDS